MQLTLRHGGLGLCSTGRHAPAAFWASWADALPTLLKRTACWPLNLSTTQTQHASCRSRCHFQLYATRCPPLAFNPCPGTSWHDLLHGEVPRLFVRDEPQLDNIRSWQRLRPSTASASQPCCQNFMPPPQHCLTHRHDRSMPAFSLHGPLCLNSSWNPPFVLFFSHRTFFWLPKVLELRSFVCLATGQPRAPHGAAARHSRLRPSPRRRRMGDLAGLPRRRRVWRGGRRTETGDSPSVAWRPWPSQRGPYRARSVLGGMG